MTVHGYQREMMEAWLDPDLSAVMVKIARGNAKTTTAAAFLVAHIFMSEGARAWCVATTIGQSVDGVYGTAIEMIELEPALASRADIHTANGATYVEIDGMRSRAEPKANDKRTLQGGKCSLYVLDECAQQHADVWNALYLSIGKRRSMCIGISTPSFVPNNAMFTVEKKVNEGTTLPQFKFLRWQVPDGADHTDESLWPLASPALAAGIKHVEDLRAALALSPEADFRCYMLGQSGLSAGDDCWLGANADAYLSEIVDREYVLDPALPVYWGADLSKNHDHSAVVGIQQRPDGVWWATSKVWIPSDDNPIDYEEIRTYIVDMFRRYPLSAGLAYDPMLFSDSAQILTKHHGIKVFETANTPTRIAPLCSDAYMLIRTKQLAFDGDTQFRQHLLNAQRAETKGGWVLQKYQKRDSFKIDSVYALLFALSIRDVYVPKPGAKFMVSVPLRRAA